MKSLLLLAREHSRAEAGKQWIGKGPAGMEVSYSFSRELIPTDKMERERNHW
jgi:hypothetical protein